MGSLERWAASLGPAGRLEIAHVMCRKLSSGGSYTCKYLLGYQATCCWTLHSAGGRAELTSGECLSTR